MELKKEAATRTDVYHVDPHKLEIIPGWNARNFDDAENKAHVEFLAASIAENGVDKPLAIRVEDGKFLIVDGECRWRGAMLAIKNGAEILTVPVINEKRYAVSEADRLLKQIVGNSGKNFTSLEQADVFARLMALGWTEPQIATKAACSVQHVRDLLQLRAAPTKVTKMVRAGKISATLALQTVKKSKGDGEAAVKTLAKAVKSAGKTGKKKATARHVSAKGRTFKQTIRELLDGISFVGMVAGAGLPGVTAPETVTVTMPAKTWEALQAIKK